MTVISLHYHLSALAYMFIIGIQNMTVTFKGHSTNLKVTFYN